MGWYQRCFKGRGASNWAPPFKKLWSNLKFPFQLKLDVTRFARARTHTTFTVIWTFFHLTNFWGRETRSEKFIFCAPNAFSGFRKQKDLLHVRYQWSTTRHHSQKYIFSNSYFELYARDLRWRCRRTQFWDSLLKLEWLWIEILDFTKVSSKHVSIYF